MVATFFLLFVLFCRLFYIQIVWGKNLQTKASDQWTRDLNLTALRGDVVDRNGEILATSSTVFNVYVRPNAVKNKENTAKVLADVLGLNFDLILQKVTKKGVSEVLIARKIPTLVVNILKEKGLTGVYFAEESFREYPFGDFLTQVLGYVSVDGIGQTGLEAYYDKYLQGIDGTLLTQTDLVGKELDGVQYYLPSQKGLTVQLTIDSRIQMIVENVLDLAMYQYSPQKAECIVLDVTDGSILAMSSKPSFDLNNVPRDDLQKLATYSKNVLLTDIYEPGSTFKVVTAAASLEENFLGRGGFDENHVFHNNSRTRVVDGSKISCWSTHANGKHSNQKLSDALNNSCNPIFTDIALSLGKNTFYKYLEAFGFGSKTNVDFQGEQSGLLIDQSLVKNADLARIGFGQSVTVTPLQLCLATAAAVNGGILYQPKLLNSIVDQYSGVVLTNPSVMKNRAISEDTSKKLAQMLEGVVSNGSGKQAYVEGYKVGGKTGTAQKFENGSLAVGKYVSSFIGFFPSNSPKYLVLMLVDEPIGQNYGSVVAAPYAKMVIEGIIDVYDVAPQE
ncbi:MAG: stage V sporulation protein D [Clostridia bacterium]|nr:stage V sporulation protein D [Clostridia bacterium]